MSGNPELERKTETIARRMAREAGQPEGLWELFLSAAYMEVFPITPQEKEAASSRPAE